MSDRQLPPALAEKIFLTGIYIPTPRSILVKIVMVIGDPSTTLACSATGGRPCDWCSSIKELAGNPYSAYHH
jgi:hypothetical protein